MAVLACEICGGKLMGQPGGVFECTQCGMEYSTAWIRAKLGNSIETKAAPAAAGEEMAHTQDPHWGFLSAGRMHTVGLRKDGTVVAVGLNEDGQCDVQDWTDIIAIAVGDRHIVGLKSDGTVVSAGEEVYEQRDVDSWQLQTKR